MDVEFVENQVVLKKLVPGDGVKFTVKLTNESNIAVKYRVRISSVAPDGVERLIKFTIILWFKFQS